jgi:hypothetical protein
MPPTAALCGATDGRVVRHQQRQRSAAAILRGPVQWGDKASGTSSGFRSSAEVKAAWSISVTMAFVGTQPLIRTQPIAPLNSFAHKSIPNRSKLALPRQSSRLQPRPLSCLRSCRANSLRPLRWQIRPHSRALHIGKQQGSLCRRHSVPAADTLASWPPLRTARAPR